MWVPVLLFVSALIGLAAGQGCVSKRFGSDRIVCVCNDTYCDSVPKLPKLDRYGASIITSSLSGKRFHVQQRMFQPRSKKSSSWSSSAVRILVDARSFFQNILGFGGAFSDAAGLNLAALSHRAAHKLLEAYFSPENGIGYTFGRVPMASTDFGTREYSYADTSGDLELKSFALQPEDLDYKIPFIKTAQLIANGNLKLFASPWSAPGWMKTNGRMIGGAALRGPLDGPYYSTWASYFVKFFEQYAANGILYWGLTMQNEPTSGINPDYTWQTMYFNASMQRHFLVNHLGPRLKGSPLTRGLKVLILDDDRPQLPAWADEVFADAKAREYADGIGVHWYMDAFAPASLLTETALRHPDKFILATEACSGFLGVHGPILGDWSRAENYAADIIDDLNNFVSGWVDWNLVLDTTGGPTFVANNADAPILRNGTRGSDEFYKQPTYYALGHFSAWVPVGSTRIKSQLLDRDPALKLVAFSFKSKRVAVVLNRGDSEKTVEIHDPLMPERVLTMKIEGHSISTIVWNKA
ncbi:unnamed protein product, partial [Mesorhabditis spiculigera]